MNSNYFSKNTIPCGIEISYGEKEFFYDTNGKKYFDFCSQTLNLSLGHCHDIVNQAIEEASNRFTVISSRFSNDYSSRLADTIISVAPKPLKKVNLKVTSGSLANEGALKAAYKKTGKTGVVSLIGSHHGQSLETMRVSGKNFDKTYLDRSGVFFSEPGNIDQISEIINKHHDMISAIILEPVMVDAGVIILSKKYIEQVRQLCDKYSIVLIYDEVQTAFGWTGEMFASDLYDISPDILTACKGLAAGFPLAAILMTSEMDVLEYGEHEITHGAHPVVCNVALANINLLKNSDILTNVRNNGDDIAQELNKLRERYSMIEDIRGVGHIWGIEIADNTSNRTVAKKIYEECIENGLLLRLSKVGEKNNVLQFKPPLITSRESLYTAIEIIENVLKKY